MQARLISIFQNPDFHECLELVIVAKRLKGHTRTKRFFNTFGNGITKREVSFAKAYTYLNRLLYGNWLTEPEYSKIWISVQDLEYLMLGWNPAIRSRFPITYSLLGEWLSENSVPPSNQGGETSTIEKVHPLDVAWEEISYATEKKFPFEGCETAGEKLLWPNTVIGER